MFILDTDHLGIIQRKSGAEFRNLERRLLSHPDSGFHVTIISFHEQFAGWSAYVSKSRDLSATVRGYLKLEGIVRDFAMAQVLSFSVAAADIYDDLVKQRVRVGTMDLRIGAIAIANQMTVLSRNTSDFGRIPGVSVEDWTI